MRLGRLSLTRRFRDTTTVVLRTLNLIVGRDGARASGSATHPRSVVLTAFKSTAVIRGFKSTAVIGGFKSSVSLTAFKSSVSLIPRKTTVEDLWLTSP